MSNNELHSELSLVKSDKKLAEAELEASQKKWAEYVMKNKNEICSNLHPVKVKKKRSARWKEFVTKIKTMLGLTKKKEVYDGIEAYLQYRDEFSEVI